jgi:hypothetical protein
MLGRLGRGGREVRRDLAEGGADSAPATHPPEEVDELQEGDHIHTGSERRRETKRGRMRERQAKADGG